MAHSCLFLDDRNGISFICNYEDSIGWISASVPLGIRFGWRNHWVYRGLGMVLHTWRYSVDYMDVIAFRIGINALYVHGYMALIEDGYVHYN